MQCNAVMQNEKVSKSHMESKLPEFFLVGIRVGSLYNLERFRTDFGFYTKSSFKNNIFGEINERLLFLK